MNLDVASIANVSRFHVINTKTHAYYRLGKVKGNKNEDNR